MTWVITRLCRDCVDQSCVEVCPVDCIYEYTGSDNATFPNQLYIDPEECINCGVCEPECPWEAIFEDERVPEVFTDDTGINAAIVDSKDDFAVPEVSEMEKPTPEKVAESTRSCAAAGGPRHFSAAGCEIPDHTPEANIQAHAATLKEIGG